MQITVNVQLLARGQCFRSLFAFSHKTLTILPLNHNLPANWVIIALLFLPFLTFHPPANQLPFLPLIHCHCHAAVSLTFLSSSGHLLSSHHLAALHHLSIIHSYITLPFTASPEYTKDRWRCFKTPIWQTFLFASLLLLMSYVMAFYQRASLSSLSQGPYVQRLPRILPLSTHPLVRHSVRLWQ